MAGRPKKSLEAALFELAQTGRTHHPLLSRVLLARAVNVTLGGGVVGPWDIDEMGEDWLEIISSLAFDLPGYQKASQKIESIRAAWRASHPTYKNRIH